MDVFRLELVAAKEEARAMGLRPRLVSGGGDGTASFALFVVLAALAAPPPNSAAMGLCDTGNGFIWTEAELEEYFPALVQLPLGSANDLGNSLGWGQQYPGASVRACGRSARARKRVTALRAWFAHVLDRYSPTDSFDIWGIVPPRGCRGCDFKVCELDGPAGKSARVKGAARVKMNGERQLLMREASLPVPFLLCLYFSTGFSAYTVARFQLHRHSTPLRNRVEYVRQGLGIICEKTPPQLPLRLDGVRADCEDQPYFPPRRDTGNRGSGYRDVGFYNVNWQAHLFHGCSRRKLRRRCSCFRQTKDVARFNDGMIDMYRFRLKSVLKNPGFEMQTDKKKNVTLSFGLPRGKGIFFQYDGEARFAFSPSGQEFSMLIRRVLSIPVVLGPHYKAPPRPKCSSDGARGGGAVRGSGVGDVPSKDEARFSFLGDSWDEIEQVRQRLKDLLSGRLAKELLATEADLQGVGLRPAPWENGGDWAARVSSGKNERPPAHLEQVPP